MLLFFNQGPSVSYFGTYLNQVDNESILVR